MGPFVASESKLCFLDFAGIIELGEQVRHDTFPFSFCNSFVCANMLRKLAGSPNPTRFCHSRKSSACPACPELRRGKPGRRAFCYGKYMPFSRYGSVIACPKLNVKSKITAFPYVHFSASRRENVFSRTISGRRARNARASRENAGRP